MVIKTEYARCKITALNKRQARFVDEYLIDLNATQAAIRAGYSEKTAHSQGPRLLEYVDIAKEIFKAQKDRSELTGINAAWVLKRAALLADFNISKFIKVEANGDAVYDFSQASDDDWYCISEYTVDEIKRGQGDGTCSVDRVRLKMFDKLRALELVGKHVNVQAFKEKIEHTGALNIELTRTVVKSK